MPKRTREHRLADEAVRAFAEAIEPRLHFYERPQPEYGIDGDVEAFDADELATGLQFFVQVKGTDEPDRCKALAVTVSMETADYYRAAPMPVLMGRFHAPSRELYLRWFHQYDPYGSRAGEKTLTFRWQPVDRLDAGTAERLIADAQAFYELRSTMLALPRPLHVVGDGAHGVSEAELRIALRAEAAAAADLVEVAAGAPPAGAACVVLTADELSAALATVTGATLHVREGLYDDTALARQFAVDALVLLALAFERLGQDAIAARLAAAFLPRSVMAADLEVAGALAACMARAHRIGEALALAEQLDDPDNPELSDSGFAFGLAVLSAGSLSSEEAAAYERVLKLRMKRRKKTHPQDAGRAAMNLATFHRSRQRYDKAASYYETALRLDPGYADRAHYWYERGGALWGTRQHERGAEAYRRARDLGTSEPLALALEADCLMHAGLYGDALERFEQFAEHCQADDGEYRLKARAIRHLIEVTGLRDQDRHTEQALRVVEQDADSAGGWIHLSMRQLQHDALWGSAWLNIGVARSELGEEKAALESHIVSTILIPADYEAWCNAIFAALNCGEPDTVEDLLLVGRRLGGDELIDELLQRSKQLPGELPVHFARAVDETLSERGGGSAPEVKLRMISEDGRVEEVLLDEGREKPAGARDR